MGKAAWWVCDSCKSVNDLPANKCYKCREKKPSNPALIDDQYAQVSTTKRVGITVNLDELANLTSPDPKEVAEPSGFTEVLDFDEDAPIGGDEPEPIVAEEPIPAPPPLRDPTERGIGEAGGRQWDQGLQPPIVAPSAPTPDGAPPPQPAPSGYVPTSSKYQSPFGQAPVQPQSPPSPQPPPPGTVPPGVQPPPGYLPPPGQPVPPPPGYAPPPGQPMPPPPGYAPPPGQPMPPPPGYVPPPGQPVPPPPGYAPPPGQPMPPPAGYASDDAPTDTDSDQSEAG